MALVECRSSQLGVPSRWIEIAGITDVQLADLRKNIDLEIANAHQVSDAIARAFLKAASTCPGANPSDLWQHVVYRHLLQAGWSDQRWKRVSGFALERAFVELYAPRLAQFGIRMRQFSSKEANLLLANLGVEETKATKVDLFLEGKVSDGFAVFGAVHVKSSIAERIQDDVPASLAFKARGLLSIALTMDAKSYPPPHGDCVNYGELGGRSIGVEKERLKRGYIEQTGQFDALFSFNLRTPPSAPTTPSGRRIYTSQLHDAEPDQLTAFLAQEWAERRPA
jgi:hypothetical protein